MPLGKKRRMTHSKDARHYSLIVSKQESINPMAALDQTVGIGG